jgi:signal transduction histidine kinase
LLACVLSGFGVAVYQLQRVHQLNQVDEELGHLAAVLNSTFARLEAAFAQQRQFTADASHELRTPVAVIIFSTNLLTNAVEFNRPEGKIRVLVDAQQSSALLRVADTGEGIPAEDVPHIFERFYRVDKARSSHRGGTGLGLAICKAIVDAHGGSIEVSSQPGAGSTFTVRLPLP